MYKKIVKILFILILIVCFNSKVYAASFNLSLNGDNVSKTIKYVKLAYTKGDLNGNEKIYSDYATLLIDMSYMPLE